jgi:SAM-dependent methyltransferase
MIKKNKSCKYIFISSVILIIFVIIFVVLNKKKNITEGFDNFMDDYIDPFDEVYVKLYSKVFNNIQFIKYNIDEITQKTINKKYQTKDITILDAGCGSGLTYNLLSKDYDKKGVDSSGYFVRLAKIRNPMGDFFNGNLKNEKLFEGSTFTHILPFLDTIYHNSIENMNLIFANFNYWLQPNGYLCIHILDKNKLDPGPRKFSQYIHDKNNNRHSVTYFNSFTHDAWWQHDTDDANLVKYHEKFTLSNGHKKIHTTHLYIPPIKEIIKMITFHHFKLVNIIDFVKQDIEDIELYIFKKIK